MEIARFIGAFFGPLFTNDSHQYTTVKTDQAPARTYEQACKEHLQKFNDLCCKFHPVYFYRDKQYYQLIDEYTCFEVDINTESKGISRLSSKLSGGFFEAVLKHELVLNGYEEINKGEFHFHYSQVQEEINLKVNQAIQASI